MFYRINVINVELPPLRDRISDIPLLADHFLRQVCEDVGKQVSGFTDEAMTALQRYRWPGNVRELQNVIERAVLLGKDDVIGAGRFAGRRWRPGPSTSSRRPAGLSSSPLESPERQIIREALEAAGWNRNADGRRPGHQPHHALQKDEASGPGRNGDGDGTIVSPRPR